MTALRIIISIFVLCALSAAYGQNPQCLFTPGPTASNETCASTAFVQSVITRTYTVATLPSSPAVGQTANVSDGASGLSWGATVTGGHSTNYLVRWNGARWTVVGE